METPCELPSRRMGSSYGTLYQKENLVQRRDRATCGHPEGGGNSAAMRAHLVGFCPVAMRCCDLPRCKRT